MVPISDLEGDKMGKVNVFIDVNSYKKFFFLFDKDSICMGIIYAKRATYICA